MIKKLKAEKNILKISMILCGVFIIVETIISIISKSQAVLMDAVYDGTEFMMLIISMRLVPMLYKPLNEKHPYGYGQFESIFVVLKSFIMIAVTIGLIINNIQIIISGGKIVEFDFIAGFQLVVAFVSIFVVLFMKKGNKNINSKFIEMELNGWIVDIVSSLGMGVAFLVPIVFHDSNFVKLIYPYIDQVIAILLAIFMLPMPIKLLIPAFSDMFLFAPENEIMELIKEKTENILKREKLKNTTFDVIRTGRKIWISIYFEPREHWIAVLYIERIQKEIEKVLKEEFGDVYVELLPDIG